MYIFSTLSGLNSENFHPKKLKVHHRFHNKKFPTKISITEQHFSEKTFPNFSDIEDQTVFVLYLLLIKLLPVSPRLIWAFPGNIDCVWPLVCVTNKNNA